MIPRGSKRLQLAAAGRGRGSWGRHEIIVGLGPGQGLSFSLSSPSLHQQGTRPKSLVLSLKHTYTHTQHVMLENSLPLAILHPSASAELPALQQVG